MKFSSRMKVFFGALSAKGWVAFTLGAAIVAVGGAITPLVVGHFQTQARIAEAENAIGTFENAQRDLDEATRDNLVLLEQGFADSAAYVELNAKVQANAPLFSADAASRFAESVLAHQALMESAPAELVTEADPGEAAAPAFDAVAPFPSVSVAPDALMDAVHNAEDFSLRNASFRGQIEELTQLAETGRASSVRLNEARISVSDSLVALASSTDGVGAAHVDASFPKASQESREIFTAALASVLTVGDGTFVPVEAVEANEQDGVEAVPARDAWDVVNEYLDSAKAVSDSHSDVVAAEEEAARQVEEAERKRAAQNVAPKSGGGSKQGGSTQKPNSGGKSVGGNNSGRAPSTGGGSNSGGGQAPPPATGGGQAPPSTGGGNNSGGGQAPPSVGPRGTLKRAGVCNSGQGGASANWSSHLSAPTDATSVWVTFEKPGDSWGIGWECGW